MSTNNELIFDPKLNNYESLMIMILIYNYGVKGVVRGGDEGLIEVRRVATGSLRNVDWRMLNSSFEWAWATEIFS
jgi:hypothetical protein